MFTKIEEIKRAVQSFENDTVWQKLRTRWDNDYNLWRLKPYDAGTGYYSFTTNTPRVLANKLISMLANSDLVVTIPAGFKTAEERNTASNTERLFYGAVAQNNEQYVLEECPTYLNQLAWFGCVRGGVAVRPYVYKDTDGNTVLDIGIWDVYDTRYGRGKNGNVWAVHIRKATRSEIQDTYGIDLGTESADVWDYWDRKNNGIILPSKGKWAKELQPHGLDYTPVYVIRASSSPNVSHRTYQYTGQHTGESIFAATRDIIPMLSKTISDLLTIVRRGVKPPIGVWSPMGDVNIEEDIWQVNKGGAVPFRSDTIVKPILEPSMPADMVPLVELIMGEIQRGGVAHTSMGQLGFRLSGFAISQLQEAVESIVVPYKELIERASHLVSSQLVSQFANNNFPPVNIRGRDSKGQPFGYPVSVQLSPDNIEADWIPEVKLNMSMPKDDAQKFYLARLARDGETPLLSDDTIREEFLDVKDTDLENERISRQWSGNLPIIKLYKAYLAAMADGRQDIAMNIVAELARLAGGQGAQGGGSAPGFMPGITEQMAGGMPGVGSPPGGTGVPSSVMPPESLGGLPPGATGAAGA